MKTSGEELYSIPEFAWKKRFQFSKKKTNTNPNNIISPSSTLSSPLGTALGNYILSFTFLLWLQYSELWISLHRKLHITYCYIAYCMLHLEIGNTLLSMFTLYTMFFKEYTIYCILYILKYIEVKLRDVTIWA